MHTRPGGWGLMIPRLSACSTGTLIAGVGGRRPLFWVERHYEQLWLWLIDVVGKGAWREMISGVKAQRSETLRLESNLSAAENIGGR